MIHTETDGHISNRETKGRRQTGIGMDTYRKRWTDRWMDTTTYGDRKVDRQWTDEVRQYELRNDKSM